MKSSEERIAELEQRVAYLEHIIKGSEAGKEKAAYQYKEAAAGKPVPLTGNRQEAEVKQTSWDNGRGDKEALVGKYIVGALAAVLIFVGAISFIGLVWNRLTPEIKLLIISSAGILLSASGFWLIRTKKNPVTSIILGTGAGLLFIAILSANLAFHMIGNNMSILLAGIWAVLFIISSRYTNRFFTTVIAYIGSYITLILGLALMGGDGELLVLFLFASCISGVMIVTTRNKGKGEFISSLILSLVSYMTILLRCYVDGIFGAEQLLNGYGVQIAAILVVYVLMNMFYKFIDDTNAVPVYLGVGAVTTLLTVLFTSYLSYNYLSLKAITCYALFFAVNLIQFTVNQIFYKRIEKWLTRYYAVILVFTSLLINTELFEVPTGIILIALLLIAGERIFKRENQSFLTGLIVLADSIFLVSNSSGHLISTAYGMIQLGVMGYVLWKSMSLKKYRQINALKTIAAGVFICNCFGIPANIFNYIHAQNFSNYADNAAGYFIAVTAVIVLLKTGYFKNWRSEQFRFFGRNEGLEDDKGMQVLVHILSTGLYFYGIWGIAAADKTFLKLIFTLAAIAAALMQSKLILSGNGNNKPLTGIWIVLKYLMLTWTILWSFMDLNLASAVYSIAGLIVAIGSISAGFRLGNRSIRLYGLVLTIVMVAKFIIVDLSQENSITRVLALIAGGGLCFLISFIYNKLSEHHS